MRTFRVDELVQPRNLVLKNFAIEEEERAECLVLRRCRDLSFDGQGRQEARELGDVGLLGTAAVMTGPDGVANAVEEAGPAR